MLAKLWVELVLLRAKGKKRADHLDSLLKNLRIPRMIARSRRNKPVTAPFNRRSKKGCLGPSSLELPGENLIKIKLM